MVDRGNGSNGASSDPIGAMFASMDAIGRIVAEHYGRTDDLAAALRRYADSEGHDLAWTAKKAHDAMRDIEWQQQHAVLNVALGLPDDYQG